MKGISVNIVVLGAVILSLAIVLMTTGVVKNVLPEADEERNKTNEVTSKKSESAGCIAECRAENPGGGADYLTCKSACG